MYLQNKTNHSLDSVNNLVDLSSLTHKEFDTLVDKIADKLWVPKKLTLRNDYTKYVGDVTITHLKGGKK